MLFVLGCLGAGCSPIIMAELAGSPLAHARVRKPPAPKDVVEGPQHLTEMQRQGGTAKPGVRVPFVPTGLEPLSL